MKLKKFNKIKNNFLKFLSKKKSKTHYIPIFLLTIVLTFLFFTLLRNIDWDIKERPVFKYGMMEDEPAEMGDAINFDLQDPKLTNSGELMIKGALFHTMSKVLFEITENTPLNKIFETASGQELTTQPGLYYFFRFIVIMSSVLVAFLIFVLASMVTKNKYIGVIAAFLYATIFASGYFSIVYKSSIFAIASITLVLILCVWYIQKPSIFKAILMGIGLSFCFAVKFDTAFVIFPIASSLLVHAWKERKRFLIHGVASAFSALSSLFIFAPYIFLNFEVFKRGLAIQKNYQTIRPYHFEGYGFQPFAIVTHILKGSVGPVLTLIMLAGVGYVVYTILKKKRELKLYIPLFAYLVAHFLVVSTNTWIVARYTMYLYPILCTFAAIFIYDAYKYLLERKDKFAKIGFSLLSMALVFHLFWFFAFNNLMHSTTTMANAINWINKYIPADAAIADNTVTTAPPNLYGIRNTQVEYIDTYVERDAVLEGKTVNDYQFDYFVTFDRSFNEFYRLKDHPEYQSHRDFYDPLFDESQYVLIKKFETDAEFMGITFDKGFLPQDLGIINPDVYIFKKL